MTRMEQLEAQLRLLLDARFAIGMHITSVRGEMRRLKHWEQTTQRVMPGDPETTPEGIPKAHVLQMIELNERVGEYTRAAYWRDQLTKIKPRPGSVVPFNKSAT